MKFIKLSNKVKLTDAELKVYNYLNANIKAVPFMKLNSLSSQLNISKPTIMSLVYKLGYSGFKDLKEKNIHQISEKQSKQWNSQVIKEHYNILYLLDFIKQDYELKLTAKILKKARKVYIFAVSTSLISSNIFSARLLQIGIPAYSFNCGGETIPSIKHLEKNDAAVFISYSGESKGVIEMLNEVPKGVTTISLTSGNNNTIFKNTDYKIVVPHIHKSQQKFFTSRIIPFISLFEIILQHIKRL